jgi:dipeptidase D
MGVLKGVKPERVFHFFEEMCAIPHGSGNTKAISDYCLNFAKEQGLWYNQDSLNNIIIKKSASKGYEDHPAVIIQGHLDMVCEKEPGLDFDFAKDGLKLKLEGDILSASGTTLGGDDGIAIAFALAVLEDNSLFHPKIEALFTVDEETGMFGAEGFDQTLLEGKRLINIDSGEEGIFTVGCAGGARADISIKLEKSKVTAPIYEVKIGGLMGGHSGVEIDKGRLNANKLMGELLNKIPGEFNLISLSGGEKDNVIPSSCTAVIATTENLFDYAQSFKTKAVITTDPDLWVEVTPTTATAGYSYETSRKAIELITSLPNGIISMSKEIKDLVQTSLNLGVMAIKDDRLTVSFAVRSSVNAEKIELLERLSSVANKFSAEYNSHSHYPAWEYKKDSPLREKMVMAFKKCYGKEPVIEAIHAGLECGLFCDKIPNLDAVSFGPDLFEIHTCREHLSVSSVERSYNFLVEVLKNL